MEPASGWQSQQQAVCNILTWLYKVMCSAHAEAYSNPPLHYSASRCIEYPILSTINYIFYTFLPRL
eukprot:10100724-Ditylum_brightwellii.AAC.1